MQKADNCLESGRPISALEPNFPGIKTRCKNEFASRPPSTNFVISSTRISKPFANFEQAWQMLNYITDNGVTYFALQKSTET